MHTHPDDCQECAQEEQLCSQDRSPAAFEELAQLRPYAPWATCYPEAHSRNCYQGDDQASSAKGHEAQHSQQPGQVAHQEQAESLGVGPTLIRQ